MKLVDAALRYGVLLLVMVCAVLPLRVAAFTCSNTGGDMHVTFPAVVAISARQAPGAMLTDFIEAQGAMRWECRYSSGETIGLHFQGGQPAMPGKQAQVNGLTYAVFPTNLPDVGMLVELTATLASRVQATQEGPIAISGDNRPLGSARAHTHGEGRAMSSEIVASVKKIRLALVSTGPHRVKAGALQGGVVGHVGIIPGACEGAARPALQYRQPVTFSGVQFVAPTCTVPDLTVMMPPHTLAQFKGAPMKAGQWRQFAVEVQDCPAGIRHMHYRFNRPTSGLLDEVNQVMRGGYTDDVVSAKGLGIQLMSDDAGQALVYFGQERVLQLHPDIMGRGGALRIPFKARYVKPAGMLAAAGRIHVAVAFELIYD